MQNIKWGIIGCGKIAHHAPGEGVVCGTKGHIRVPLFLAAQELQIYRKGEGIIR